MELECCIECEAHYAFCISPYAAVLSKAQAIWNHVVQLQYRLSPFFKFRAFVMCFS
jgi:hypothetical protein